MNPQESDEWRMVLSQEINKEKLERADLEAAHGQCWDTQELQRDFEVRGFLAPFCVVRRKSDGKLGSLLFQHSPRYYFCWEEK